MAETPPPAEDRKSDPAEEKRQPDAKPTPEIGGPEGIEPTRYNDWERAGRCIDF